MRISSEALNRPDHKSMRRFTLAVGLLLLSCSIAGLSLEPDHIVKLIGIPLRLSYPQLLPYVLLAAAIYGLLRYYYYFILLSKTPYAARRDLLNKLVHHIHLEDGLKMVQLRSFGIYYGPIEFELGPERPWMYKRDRKAGESEPGYDTPGA